MSGCGAGLYQCISNTNCKIFEITFETFLNFPKIFSGLDWSLKQADFGSRALTITIKYNRKY